jgi:RND superfamily putative drug exporter
VFGAIGRFCARRRWPVLAAWVLLVAAGAVASGPVFAGLDASRASDRLESVQAFDVIGDNATYGARILGLVDDVPIADPAVRARITAAAAEVARIPHVGRVVDPYAGARAGLVATDGRGGVVVVDLDRSISGAERDAAINAAAARLRELQRQVPGATCRSAATRCSTARSTRRSGPTPSRQRRSRCRSR